MKKHFAISVIAVSFSVFSLLVGCGDKSKSFSTNAIAYPLKTEQLKELNLSASTEFYAENDTGVYKHIQ